MKNPSVTLVITTKNRKLELSKCLDSAIKQKGVCQILVFDDGSTDETFEFVKSNYPAITLFRSEKSLGLINARTKCAELATGNILASIDDDCLFDDISTIEQAVQYFTDPKIAAITIPVIDVLKSPEISQRAIGDLDEVYIISQYRGCAHAIRKDIFQSLGGYQKNLIRQEEETELAMRLYNSGYIIRIAGCTKPILHFHSANRNYRQIAYYRARNKFIVKYKSTPLPLLPFDLINQIGSLCLYEIKNRQLKACIAGFKNAIKEILKGNVKSERMSLSKYWFYKKLRLKGPMKINLAEINI